MLTRKEYNKKFGKQDSCEDSTSLEKSYDNKGIPCYLCKIGSYHSWSSHDSIVISEEISDLEKEYDDIGEKYNEAKYEIDKIEPDIWRQKGL